MKVQHNPEAAQPGPRRTPSETQEKKFSKVLEDKKDPVADGEKRAGGKKQDHDVRDDIRDEEWRERAATGEQPSILPSDAAAAAAAVAARSPIETGAIKETGGAAPVEPAVVNGLVAEISTTVQPGNTPAVDIRFDSKTLAGLQVRVVKAGEHISVRFNTNSENVAALLTRNTDSLSAALQARGFQVGAVTVVSEPKPPSGDQHPDSRGRSDSSGGRQGRGGRERGRR